MKQSTWLWPALPAEVAICVVSAPTSVEVGYLPTDPSGGLTTTTWTPGITKHQSQKKYCTHGSPSLHTFFAVWLFCTAEPVGLKTNFSSVMESSPRSNITLNVFNILGWAYGTDCHSNSFHWRLIGWWRWGFIWTLINKRQPCGNLCYTGQTTTTTTTTTTHHHYCYY